MYILTPIIHSLYKYDRLTFTNTTYINLNQSTYILQTDSLICNILISILKLQREGFFRFGERKKR